MHLLVLKVPRVSIHGPAALLDHEGPRGANSVVFTVRHAYANADIAAHGMEHERNMCPEIALTAISNGAT